MKRLILLFVAALAGCISGGGAGESWADAHTQPAAADQQPQTAPAPQPQSAPERQQVTVPPLTTHAVGLMQATRIETVSPSGKRVIRTGATGGQGLPRELAPVEGMAVVLRLSGPALVDVRGHMDLEHIRVPGLTQVEYSWRLAINGEWLQGAKGGSNVYDALQHYGTANFSGVAILPAGTHRIELHAKSASSDAPHADGLLKLVGEPTDAYRSDPYNQMIVIVTPWE